MENARTKKAGAGGSSKAKASSASGALSERSNKNDDRSIEQIYQKKTQLEHILLRPDTYIGSTESVNQPMWVFDDETKRIVQRPINFVPGLYKIFDEIIVNASDNKQRDPTMDTLRMDIDQENGTLSVWNNGSGIPVVVHKEHQIYVPELIFGNLLTGSNFDDGMKKTTGGRNGYGAKLANIFSTKFTIETADRKTGKKYRQTFLDNMTVREEPLVTALGPKEAEFTCVTFEPDLPRFKMESLDENTVGLLSKRAYDVAGCASGFPGKPLKVYLNGQRLQVNSFQDYLKLYRGLEPAVAFEKVNDRWEIGVSISDGQFQQVSFVNGICTVKGGQHVNYIADQVVHKLMAVVKKKNKGQEVKGHQIKNHLAVYVNALIENPAFDSQTKETLTTRPTAFGSDCGVSDKFLKTIEKSGVVDNVVKWAKFKQDEQLKRKGGSKRIKVLGIIKLDDANFAGTARSSDCTLILTEGDSAKTLAISGLSVVGRDYHGVFPLKGKPLNVREAAHQQIVKNEEIQNIVKIMGLRFGTEYTDTKSLRYGHLMIMTDQDHDGSHIKGLLINLLHHFWPSLLKVSGFLQEFITPIVKVTKGKKMEAFYTIPEYEQWKERTNEGQGWTIKYYKGLGTSTAQEAKEYFSDLDTHRIDFKWQGETDGDMIDMAFAKKRVEDRKDWLRAFEKGTYVDYKVASMSYDSFINQELILFSMADNQRSIPCIMDGLKPAQRKVLFACFKRNLKKEIKVAQLAGYVSEHSAYHHGEASLNGTIVSMAQNFVGSNNINLLFPSGQFGTRIMGGKDAASPRYVFTRLEEITRQLFHPEDDQLLPVQEEDGQAIDPEYYAPVLPTVLVNGSDGIGTGWSSTVPNYNPLDIIQNLRRMINDEEPEEMHPWYRGFAGTIEPKAGKDRGSYIVSGTFRRIDDVTIEVTELPVKKWTQDYKQFLESMTIGVSDEKGAFVKDFKERHTDTSVYFIITLSETACPELLVDDHALLKKLKLEASLSTSNMHLFDVHGHIKKYETPNAVLQEYYPLRLELYEKRREALLKKMEKDWRRMDNKMRFILSVVEGRIVVSNRKKAELLQELAREGYELFDNRGEDGAEGVVPENDSELARGYDYLLSLKIWNLTLEKVQELKEQLQAKEAELEALRRTTPSDLWIRDLDQVEEALVAYNESLEIEAACDIAANKGEGKGRGGGKAKKAAVKAKARKAKKAARGSDDDDISESSDEEDDFFDEESDSDFCPSPKKKAPPKLKPVAAPKPPAAVAPKASTSAATTKATSKKAASTTTTKAAVARSSESAAAPAKRAAAANKKKKVIDDEDESFSEKGDSDEEDVVIMSLAERMRRRMQVSPSKAPKYTELSSDDDAEEEEREVEVVHQQAEEEEDEKEDDIFMIQSPPPKLKAVPKAKAAAGGGGAVKRVSKKSEQTDRPALFSPDKNVSPAVVKKARATTTAVPKTKKTATTAAKPAPKKKPAAAPAKATKKAAAAPPARKRKDESSDEDDDDDVFEVDDMMDVGPVVPRATAPRRAAAAKAVVYNVDDEEEDDESEFSDEEEDDDSDFEG